MASMRTEAFLHAHGLTVEPEDLSNMLAQAIRSLGRVLYRPDARRELTEAEAGALVRGGFDLRARDLGKEDPLARTAAEYAALLSESWTVAEVARKLGVNTSRVRQRIAGRTIYALKYGKEWRIPRFQFEKNRLIPGLEQVLPRLGPELYPVAVYRWFTTPNPDLVHKDVPGKRISPREWLRAGLPPQVVADLAADL